LKKILILLCGLIIILASFKNKDEQNIILNQDSIRLRIISNSNDEVDINTKMNLKNHLEDYLFDLIKDANSKEEVDNIIENNFENINLYINKYLNTNNYKLDYGLNYFPKKIYKGVVYQEGMYKSLVITLGNGYGKNWWCVLFPPLCLLEENSNTTDVEYKLLISRIIDSFN